MICIIIDDVTLQDKDVAHFWELGGGTWLSKLADLTITADTLRSVLSFRRHLHYFAVIS